MATLKIDTVSRWFGNVVAVNDVTMEFGPGVTGLLGPNGAGKSTLINMMGGFLPPSSGAVTLDDAPVWRNEGIYRRIGLVPEREAMYDGVSGYDFVLANAKLHGLPDAAAATKRAIETVDLVEAQSRPISTYSKGMRQRAKLATALVHDPQVLLLDEPFNGLDPRQRIHLMDLLRTMGKEGRTVIVSSHILEEVEELASRIEVMVSGRHAASGGFREIRKLMTERPHQYTIRSGDDRALASAIIAERCASAVQLVLPKGAGTAPGVSHDATLQVQATDVGEFVRVLPRLALSRGIRLYEVSPADESLESVFAYLVAR
ncbi:ABC transporter ATP-binding protein [Sporichthya sp.]|uniref:ABC transporter ATP-binding protein n=1 Tax=Sporichthya sp. TaxID=65475 RepID=UPI001803321F|nr:ABC transporter ATP-binding protein [Sporichthya sp.]MBA3743654.1 ABC transporter ATP-binding protein [Sporichthya sp.]